VRYVLAAANRQLLAKVGRSTTPALGNKGSARGLEPEWALNGGE
jgi:hypothetical protein